LSKDIVPDSESYSKKRVSGPLVREDKHVAFKEACNEVGVSQADVLRDAIDAFVEEHTEAAGAGESVDGHYPDDPQLRELYEVCWKYCDGHLKIYQSRHASAIAKAMKTFGKTDLGEALRPLRNKGYVAMGAMPLDLVDEAYRKRQHWHVKPPCADPEAWKHSEVDG